MEQTLIDFFARSSELILHNRLPTSQLPYNTGSTNTFNSTNPRFQLSFDRKVDFVSHLPSEWNLQPEKSLVIEFFVCSKTTGERFLAEQWIFQVSPECHGNLEDTIDSPNTLYKRLSVLLRTISLLTITLPMYQKAVKERGSSCLSQSFIIEYSISYTKDALSTWHPTVYKNNDLSNYSASDFVLPGRMFSFRVNYSKSLSFLQKSIEDEFEHVEAEEPVLDIKKAGLVRRAFSDNIYNKGMRAQDFEFLDGSPPEVNPFEHEDDAYCSSQVEGIQTRKRINSMFTRRTEFIPRVWDVSKILEASKLKAKTFESDSFGEGDIFLCENDEEKFTEVLSWKDVSMMAQSSTRLTIKEKDSDGSSGFPMLKILSEDSDRSRMKTSVNMRPLEKIIGCTQDDKIAELLNSIQDLKTLAARQQSNRSECEKIAGYQSREETKGKGLRFEGVVKNKRELDKKVLDPFVDMNELKQLYLQVKRSEPTKGSRPSRQEV